MSAQRWEVLALIGNHWENVWQQDGEPLLFDTPDEAALEIVEHLRDCAEAFNCGDLLEAPTADSFRIAPHVGRANT